MSVERTLFAFGGTMVMLTSLLALFHNPNWTWVTLLLDSTVFKVHLPASAHQAG